MFNKMQSTHLSRTTELVLDLHGYSLERAKFCILHTLAHINNISKIRIITGRGNHINKTGERGILYKSLRSWLTESAYQGRIKRIDTCDGYYELHLRSNNDTLQHKVAQDASISFDQLFPNVDFVQTMADAENADAQFVFATYLMQAAKNDQDLKRIFSYYLKAANNNHADAMISVACSYMVGRGCKQNDKEAIKWLEKALTIGQIEAPLLLGDMYWSGYGVEQDEVKAVFYYTQGLERNDPVAIRKLASAYNTGIGVKEKDKNKAFELYKKSADLGEVTSQYNAGCMYEQGIGIKRDLTLAYEYFLLAAKGGDPDAQCKVGHNYKFGWVGSRDQEQGTYWINLAAENGSTQALQILKWSKADDATLEKSAQAGNIFDAVKLKLKKRQLSATDEVLEKLFKESYVELRDLLDNNIINLEERAKFYLLDKLFEDKNVVYRKKALRILRNMAEQNCIFSIRRLYYAYYKGRGVQGNKAQALSYLEQGHQLQDGKCIMSLAIIHNKKAKNTGEILEKALDYYEKAATLGYPPANYHIGMYYLNKQDVPKGISYLKKAINLERDRKTCLSKFDSGTCDSYAHPIKQDAALRIGVAYLTNSNHDVQQFIKGWRYLRLAAHWGNAQALESLKKSKKSELYTKLPSEWFEPIDELLLAVDAKEAVPIEEIIESYFTKTCNTNDSSVMSSSSHGNANAMIASLEIKIILEKYKTNNIEQAFRRAAGFGTIEDLSLILKFVPDVIDAVGADSKKTALHIAAQQNRRENFKFLLEQGADTTLMDSQNKTALEYFSGMVDNKQDAEISNTLASPMLSQFRKNSQSKTVESLEDYSSGYFQTGSCNIL